MSKKPLFDMHWDIDKYKSKYDKQHWNLCRSFMLTHKSKYPESKLVNLTEAFYQIGVYGSSYDDKTTRIVSALSIEVLEELLQSNPGLLRHPFNSSLPVIPQESSKQSVPTSKESPASKDISEGTRKTNPGGSIWDVQVDQKVVVNSLSDVDLQSLLKGFVIIYDVSKISTMIDNKITILEESFRRSKFGPCHWDRQDTNNKDSPIKLALKWRGTVLAEAVGVDYENLRTRLAQAVLSKIAKFSHGIEAKWSYYRDGRKPDVFDNPNPRRSGFYKVLVHSQLRTMAEMYSYIDTFANSDSFAEIIFGLDFSVHEKELIEEYVSKSWGSKLCTRTVSKPAGAGVGAKASTTHLCVCQVRTGDELRRWLDQCGAENERFRIVPPGYHRRAGMADLNVKETLSLTRVEPPTVDLTDEEPSDKMPSSEDKNGTFKIPNIPVNKTVNPVNQPANKSTKQIQQAQSGSPSPPVQRGPQKNAVPEIVPNKSPNQMQKANTSPSPQVMKEFASNKPSNVMQQANSNSSPQVVKEDAANKPEKQTQQQANSSPNPPVLKEPPKNLQESEGVGDDLESKLNGFVLFYNAGKNSKIDKDDWLTALCESFKLSQFGPLEVICTNVRPLRTRCELKWKGETLASAEGLTETQARTGATLQLISRLEPFTYIIQAKEEYFVDGKVPEFVVDEAKKIEVCRVMNRKDLPSYYSIFQSIDAFSQTPNYQEIVFGSDFSWDLKQEIVVYLQAKGMDYRYFTSGKAGEDEHSTHMAVFHTIDPVALKKQLIDCGGETEKYKLIPPSKPEQQLNKSDAQKTTKAADKPLEQPPAKKVEEAPTSGKAPSAPLSQHAKKSPDVALASSAPQSPVKAGNQSREKAATLVQSPVQSPQEKRGNQAQVKPVNHTQATRPNLTQITITDNEVKEKSTGQSQAKTAPQGQTNAEKQDQTNTAKQDQTKPANQAESNQTQEKTEKQDQATAGNKVEESNKNKDATGLDKTAVEKPSPNQTPAKPNQVQAKTSNQAQVKAGNQAAQKTTINKENTDGNKSSGSSTKKAADKRKLAEKEKEAPQNTIQINLKKFKKDTVEYPEDTGGDFPGLILWIGIRKNSTWQRNLFFILLESFKMSKYGELNVEEQEETVWGRKEPMKKCVIKSGRKVLAVGLGETKAEAKHSAAQQVLRSLRKHCYTIQAKESYFRDGKATPYDFTPDPSKEHVYKVMKRDKFKDRASIIRYVDNFSKKYHDEEIIFGDDFSYEEREHILEHCRRIALGHRTMKCQSAARGVHTHVSMYHQRPLPALKAALAETGGENEKFLLVPPGGRITAQATLQPTTNEDMWPETLGDKKDDPKPSPGAKPAEKPSSNQNPPHPLLDVKQPQLPPALPGPSMPSLPALAQAYAQEMQMAADLQMAANMGFGLVPANAVPFMPYQEMPLVFGPQPPMVYLPLQPAPVPSGPQPQQTEADLRQELERKREVAAKETKEKDRQVFDTSEEIKVVRKQEEDQGDWSRTVFVDKEEKKMEKPSPGKATDLREKLRQKEGPRKASPEGLRNNDMREKVKTFGRGRGVQRGALRGRGRMLGDRSPERRRIEQREFRRFSPARDVREDRFREERFGRNQEFYEERRVVHDTSPGLMRERFRSPVNRRRSLSPRRNFREERRVRHTSPPRRFRDLWDNIDERFSQSIFMYKYVKQDSCAETDPYSLLRATRSLDFNVDFDFITNQISPDEWEVAVELVTDDNNIHPLVGEGIGMTEGEARYTAALHAVDTIQKACRVIEPNRGYFMEGGVPDFIARKFPMKTHIYEIIQNLDPTQPLDRYTIGVMFDVFHKSNMEDLFFLASDFSYLERVLVIEVSNKMNLWWRLFGPRHPDASPDDVVSTQHVCITKQKSALQLARELIENGGSTEKFTLVDPRVTRITHPHWSRQERY